MPRSDPALQIAKTKKESLWHDLRACESCGTRLAGFR